MRKFFAVFLGFCLAGGPAFAVDIPDKALRERVDALSGTLSENGGGWDAYEDFLHPDYSRWAIGELYQTRAPFVESLKEWWDYGMRVASRESEIVGADITGDVAIIRTKTKETFRGPDGEAGGYAGYVANVWLREKGEWMLLSAEIAPAAD